MHETRCTTFLSLPRAFALLERGVLSPRMDLPRRHYAVCRRGRRLRHGEASLPSALLSDRAVLGRLAGPYRLRLPRAPGVPIALPAQVVRLGGHVDRHVLRGIAERVHRVATVFDDLHLLAEQAAVEDDALVGFAQVLGPARGDRALAHPGE